jgi:hypothetical protein
MSRLVSNDCIPANGAYAGVALPGDVMSDRGKENARCSFEFCLSCLFLTISAT